MSGYGAFARHYDALTANVDYRRRAAYFDRLIRRHGLKRDGLLLDLACGTGSLTLELAALGYDVIGADASEEMLSVAVEKASEAGRSVLFLNQSMEELDLYGTVQTVVCGLDSLNHLPDEAALDRAIARVSLFLEPGGGFLFDLNTEYKHREILGDNVYLYDLDQVFCAWQNAYSIDHHRVDITLDFFAPDGSGRYVRETEQFSERIFDRQAVCGLLEKHGLEWMAVYGDDGFDPPDGQTQRIIYAAKKL